MPSWNQKVIFGTLMVPIIGTRTEKATAHCHFTHQLTVWSADAYY
jgi:hypothetical protein